MKVTIRATRATDRYITGSQVTAQSTVKVTIKATRATDRSIHNWFSVHHAQSTVKVTVRASRVLATIIYFSIYLLKAYSAANALIVPNMSLIH